MPCSCHKASQLSGKGLPRSSFMYCSPALWAVDRRRRQRSYCVNQRCTRSPILTALIYKTNNTIKTETGALAKLSGTICVCMSSIGVIPSLLLEKLAREMQPVGGESVDIVCICKLTDHYSQQQLSCSVAQTMRLHSYFLSFHNLCSVEVWMHLQNSFTFSVSFQNYLKEYSNGYCTSLCLRSKSKQQRFGP